MNHSSDLRRTGAETAQCRWRWSPETPGVRDRLPFVFVTPDRRFHIREAAFSRLGNALKVLEYPGCCYQRPEGCCRFGPSRFASVGGFWWRSSGRPHTLTLFPIKKSFCCGSFGSHASKYIHFHRKCFVLEVRCFLGLLSDLRWITVPPLLNTHTRTHTPITENTNKSPDPAPPAQSWLVMGSTPGKIQNKGLIHYFVERESV